MCYWRPRRHSDDGRGRGDGGGPWINWVENSSYESLASSKLYVAGGFCSNQTLYFKLSLNLLVALYLISKTPAQDKLGRLVGWHLIYNFHLIIYCSRQLYEYGLVESSNQRFLVLLLLLFPHRFNLATLKINIIQLLLGSQRFFIISTINSSKTLNSRKFDRNKGQMSQTIYTQQQQ